MLFYMVSLMCTVIPCAVINTEAPPLVGSGKSDVVSVMSDSPVRENISFPEGQFNSNEQKASRGRSYSPSTKSKFKVNQLSAQEEVSDYSPITLLKNPNPIVTIKDGSLRGFIMHTINSRPFAGFQGIPFAEKPIGELRFAAPKRNLPWNSLRDAIEPAPQCIQADYMKQYFVHGQEDCLYLNVYTPNPSSSGKRGLPVMVFIHGGGFFFGSSSIYGPEYMLDQDIVLVSMNYRLGPLGFLATGDDACPGNNGLKDQSLALRWVKENIASFGGDPNSVTIFGESAGASSVQFHFLSPLSRGLFHRGISQSGSSTCFWSIDERAPETAKRFGEMLNCSAPSSEAMISCLREKDATQLASSHVFFLEWLMYPVVVFGPVVEPASASPEAFLTEQPEEVYKQKRAAKVPWISGYNSDEGAVNIAVLFLDNKTIPQLNNEWSKYGPIFLGMKDSGDEVVQKVRDNYLGNKEISFENRKAAIDMFGDRYSITCGLKAMRYHSKYTRQPVYAYQLSYSGKYSVVQLLGQNAQDWGVSHLDDLVYQFNNTGYYPQLQLKDDEYQFSRVMNNIWSNFARYSKPYLSTEEHLKDIWEPIEKSQSLHSPLKFLDLNLAPKMIDNPFADRENFWKGLKLQEYN